MKNRKLITVITAGCENNCQRNIINGIISQAFSLNCDVAIFLTISGSPPESIQRETENNIYSLINYEHSDGIIYDFNSFKDLSIAKNLGITLKSLDIPVVQLGNSNFDCFRTVSESNINSFEKITEHLIEIHDCHNIFFLSEDDCTDIQGYKNTMKMHGLICRFSDSAETLASKIISGKISRPDAVICTDDISASELSDILIKNGMRIPDDIIITGFGNTYESKLNSPSLTTYEKPDFRFGANAMNNIYTMITGINAPLIECPCGSLVLRESCGCAMSCYEINNLVNMFKENKKSIKLMKKSNMLTNITSVRSTDECIQKAESFLSLIPNISELFICLFPENSDFPPEKINMKLHSINGKIIEADKNKTFPASLMLPELHQASDEPRAFFFNLLNHGENIFGYSVASCGNNPPYLFDKIYPTWIYCMNLGLEYARLNGNIRNIADNIYLSSIKDNLTGVYNEKGFRKFFKEKAFTAYENKSSLFVFIIETDNLKKINELYGFSEGNNTITVLASAISESFSQEETVCRLQNSRFIVIGEGMYNQKIISEYINLITACILKYNNSSQKPYKININYGSAFSGIDNPIEKESLLKAAEASLENMRCSGKKICEIPHYEKLLRIRERIYSNPDKSMNVDSLCQELFISKGYFQRIYSKCFGTSVTEDIINSRISKAKKLLHDTNINIIAVAEQCGYDSYEYFLHQFKHITGMTPSQFRNNK